MRAIWFLAISEIAVLVFLFVGKFSDLATGSDAAGHAALGTFELGAVAISLYLLCQSPADSASSLDWVSGVLAVFAAAMGFASYSITLFAIYLIVRDRNDRYTKAAGTVVLAAAVQAVWAPLVFWQAVVSVSRN